MNRNEQLKERFLTYYEKALRPNLGRVTEEMGISYSSFLRWKNGSLLYSDASLDKIEVFLNNHKE